MVSNEVPIGPIVMVILATVGMVLFAFWSAAQRRKALAAWAQAHGLAFSPGSDRDMDDRHAHFNCLRKGHSRSARNIMRGELDRLQVVAFDYHYVTGHGKNRRQHRISALIARSEVPLKHLFIRREHAFDKVTEFFGADDIDFESAEFSKKFYVKAKDRKWAYAVIHQGMMDYLMRSKKFSTQFDTHEIIVWRSRRFAPDEFLTAAHFIRGMLDLLPDYLVQEQKDLLRN